MNMRITRRKNGSLTETHYSRLFQPRRYRSHPFAGSFTTGAVAVASGRKFLVLRSTASTSKWGFDGWMSRALLCGRTGESEKKKDRQPVKRSRLSEVDPDLIAK